MSQSEPIFGEDEAIEYEKATVRFCIKKERKNIVRYVIKLNTVVFLN
jgi:hypothetical protein